MFAACRAQWQGENYSLYWVLLEHKMHRFYVLMFQIALLDWQGAQMHRYQFTHLFAQRDPMLCGACMLPTKALPSHTCSAVAQLAVTSRQALKGWPVIIPSPALTHWHLQHNYYLTSYKNTVQKVRYTAPLVQFTFSTWNLPSFPWFEVENEALQHWVDRSWASVTSLRETGVSSLDLGKTVVPIVMVMVNRWVTVKRSSFHNHDPRSSDFSQYKPVGSAGRLHCMTSLWLLGTAPPSALLLRTHCLPPTAPNWAPAQKQSRADSSVPGAGALSSWKLLPQQPSETIAGAPPQALDSPRQGALCPTRCWAHLPFLLPDMFNQPHCPGKATWEQACGLFFGPAAKFSAAQMTFFKGAREWAEQALFWFDLSPCLVIIS